MSSSFLHLGEKPLGKLQLEGGLMCHADGILCRIRLDFSSVLKGLIMNKSQKLICSTLIASSLLPLTASADGASYYTDAESIDQLYQQCLEKLYKPHNIYCIRGKDETSNKVQKTDVLDPRTRFFDAANRIVGKGPNDEALKILIEINVAGDSPASPYAIHMASVDIYKKFYAYGRVPIIAVSTSLDSFEQQGAGIIHHGTTSVTKWFNEKLKELPIVKVGSPEGNVFYEKNQALLNEATKKEKELNQIKSEKTNPNCEYITFTGVATVYPEDLVSLNKIKDKKDAISAYPLVCETKSGGTQLRDGGVLNPYSFTKCKGFSYFEKKKAKIVRWTADSYVVATNVDFNTGRMPLTMFINRQGAVCSK